jgi:DDE_Tnp_1-associated
MEGLMVCLSLFSGLADPRDASGRRYRLESLLGLSLVGLLWGRNSLASIWRLAQGFTVEQRLALGFDRWRLPSHPILTTLLQKLDADALETHLRQMVLSSGEGAAGAVALDGKTLRGSRHGEHRAMHVLSAFSRDLSGVLHQEARGRR